MKATEKKTKKIKKGDKVLAIAGNYRGQTGTVLLVTGDGAVVQGLNIKKKHVKKSNTHPQGGIIEIEKPINLSNLMVCSSTDQPLKLKMKVTGDQQKELVYKTGGSEVVYRNVRNQKSAG